MTARSVATSIANRAADLQRQAIQARDIAVALEQENAELRRQLEAATEFVSHKLCTCVWVTVWAGEDDMDGDLLPCDRCIILGHLRLPLNPAEQDADDAAVPFS